MKFGSALRSLKGKSSADVSPPGTRSRGGEAFPETLSLAGSELVLNGLGIRQATIFNVNVYVAGLYVAARSAEVETLLDLSTPILLELRFVRDVDQDTMNEALADGFARNGGGASGSAELLRTGVEELKSWVPDLKSGMRLRLAWIPGEGVRMDVDDNVMGTIPGEAFASSLYRIWLGAEPPNAGLKQGLLGL